jgi:rod shape-determining protein MreC
MLRLWERLGDWILFAALIIVSVVIILSWNEPMIKGFRARALSLTGTVESTFAVAGGYLRALEENESLRAENIRLSSEVARLREASLENERLRDMLAYADSLPPERLPARIVYKDILRERNTLTIDVGRRNGVEVDMAVIDPRGIVGKVVLVGERFSQVMSYQNTEFFVPAKIQPHQSDGIIRWSGERRDLLEMDHVMKSDPVEPGQPVVTSGYSSVFRPGLPIGVVERVEALSGTPSWRVFVRPLAQLGDAEHVFVLLERPDPERIPPPS